MRSKQLHCFFILVLLQLIFLTVFAAGRESSSNVQTQNHTNQSILVKYKSASSINSLSAKKNKNKYIQKIRRLLSDNKSNGKFVRRGKAKRLEKWVEMTLNDPAEYKKAYMELAQDPEIEFVEPNYIYQTTVLPNDPMLSSLWGLVNTGQNNGTPGVDVNVQNLWDFSNTERDVVVAVIDTGVDYNHEDLAATIWINTDEIENNGVDDDANGYIDDFHGYDFAYNDSNPLDDFGHGTHVAGTIGAVGNNEIGVTGVSNNVQIMPVKFLGSSGGGTAQNAVLAIQYAVNNGAHIINASWGGSGFSQAIYDAISDANDAGVLFIAAAGNSTSDNDALSHYPSSYDLDNIIAVAAIDRFGNLSTFSNWGLRSVDIAAPGTDIMSTYLNDQYRTFSGTSMAAPHVAGAVAILKAEDLDRTPSQISNLLYSSVVQTDALQNKISTQGHLNVGSAANCTADTMSINPYTINNNFSLYSNERMVVAVRLFSCDLIISNATVSVTSSLTNRTFSLHDDGVNGDETADDGIYSAFWTPTTSGNTTITINASHASYDNETIELAGNIITEPDYFYDDQYTYSWIDTSLGESHALGDDSSEEIPIGFKFDYFGVEFEKVYINSNGSISFGLANGRYNNIPVPDPSSPNNVVAVFWDDLNPSVAGTITSDMSGSEPNRILTISWEDVPRYLLSSTQDISIQVSIHESSGNIVMQYKDVIVEDERFNDGASATVGIENSIGTRGVSYSYNTPSLNNELAILFTPQARPIAISNGPYSGLANEVVNFSGEASSEMLEPTYTYSWNFGDSGTSQVQSPSHTYLERGIYSVELVVNDGQLDSMPDVTKAIIGPNTLPVAVVGEGYTGFANSLIQFDGSNSTDEDGDALSFAWDFGDGVTGFGTNPTHVYQAPGDFTITLIVNDGYGDSEPATTTVTLQNRIPVADISANAAGARGFPILFDASLSNDPDQTPISYSWDFDDGSTATTNQVNHTFTSTGTFEVTLTVSDGELTDSISHTISIVEDIQPVANAGGPYTAFINEEIQFDGSASRDDDEDSLTYYWEFGDGNDGSSVNPVHSYDVPGEYTVTLLVNDGLVDSVLSTTTATIPDRKPIAIISGTYNIELGEQIQFDGTQSYDPEGNALSYLWQFGDGVIRSGATPVHTYHSGGNFTVSLTVHDGVQNSDTVEVNVQVSAAPEANAGDDRTVTVSESVNLDGSASVDSDGEIISYQWTQLSGPVVELTDDTTSVANFVAPDNVMDWHAVDGGETHSCAVQDDKSLWCWGKNTYGQLGTGDSLHYNYPVRIANQSGISWSQVSTGSSHTCAITETAELWCWGQNLSGQLGIGENNFQQILPQQVLNRTDENWLSVSAGYSHTCALSESNSIWCWGSNSDGELGQGNYIDQNSPVKIILENVESWLDISAGDDFTCGVDSIGNVFCWGENRSWQVSPESYDYRISVPTLVLDYSKLSWDRVETKDSHACALRSDGLLGCWGSNSSGQLGSGNNNYRSVPRNVITPVGFYWKDFSIGESHSCAIRSDDSVWCWGQDNYGQLGNGESEVLSNVNIPVPVSIPIGFMAKHINVGKRHSCAVSTDKQAICWGYGVDGQLGNQLSVNQFSPAGVAGHNILSFELSVIDNSDVSATDVVFIKLNTPPQAQLQAEFSAFATEAIKFTSPLSSDVDGDPLSFNWDLGDGNNSQDIEPIHTYELPGNYTISLTISDGYSDSETVTAALTVPNRLPNAVITSRNIAATNYEISFNGSESNDPDGATLTYLWDFGDGATSELESPFHTFTTPGDYTVSLIVNDGTTDSIAMIKTITVINDTPPEANPGGPYVGNNDSYITFDASSSTDLEEDTLTFHWDFGDGEISEGVNVNHLYSNHGEYEVTLTVDDGVLTTVSVITVSIENRMPVANINGTTNVELGRSASFNSSSSQDPDRDELTYLWDFGDTTTSTDQTVYHTYESPGDYVVTLVVNDGIVDSDPVEHNIRVYTIPIANAGELQIVSLNESFSVDGSGSADQDGEISQFSWAQISGPETAISPTDSVIANGTAATVNNHWRKVAVGYSHSCGILSDSSLWCWGSNSYGQIGNGSTSYVVDEPSQITSPELLGWKDIISGFNHSCAIRNDNSMWCWGANYHGQAGSGTLDHLFIEPNQVVTNNQIEWESADTMNNHNCAISTQGELYCWGNNDHGRSGQIGSSSVIRPEVVAHPDNLTWMTLAVGYSHSCAIDSENALWCWGYNGYRQLGTGNSNNSVSHPEVVVTADTITWERVVAGSNHSCGLADNSVYCWGRNTEGQLGNPITYYIAEPTLVTGDNQFKKITAGHNHNCALDINDKPMCWGLNNYGVLGVADYSLSYQITPIHSIMSDVFSGVLIEANSNNVCVLGNIGSLWCWGRNNKNQVSRSSSSSIFVPSLIEKNDNVLGYELSVLDADNYQNSDVANIIINSPPIAVLTESYSINVNEIVRFDGSLSHDTELSQISYFWTIEGMNENPRSPQIEHSFADAGEYRVTLQVNDGFVDSELVTATVTVNGVPQANDDEITTTEDNQIQFPVLDNDVDELPNLLQIVSHSETSNGSIELLEDSQFLYIPDSEFSGSDTFDYTIRDVGGLEHTATVIISITILNDKPESYSQDVLMDEDSEADVTLTAFDADENPLVFSIVSEPTNGSLIAFNQDSGTITYKVNQDYNGSDSFTFKVNDGSLDSEISTVNITISSINDAPVSNDDSFSAFRNERLVTGSVFVNDGDVDEDEIQVSEFTQPAHGVAFYNNDGTFSYVPESDFLGKDTFQYTISDPAGLNSVSTVSIFVVISDAGVEAENFTLISKEDEPLSIDLISLLGEQQGNIIIDSNGILGTLQIQTDETYLYSSPSNSHGETSFSYQVIFDNMITAKGTIVIDVLDVNDPPVANDESFDVDANSSFITTNVLLNDTDIDDSELRIISHTQPSNGTAIYNNDGSFTYIPNENYSGPDFIEYTLDDYRNGTDIGVIELLVGDVVIVPLSFILSGVEDDILSIDLLELLNYGSEKSVELVINSESLSGELTNQGDGKLTYSPIANWFGNTSFAFNVLFDNKVINEVSVSINIADVNDTPVTQNENYELTKNEDMITENVLMNDTDIDDDNLRVVEYTQPSNGTVIYDNAGRFTYTPNHDFVGLDTISYTIDDFRNGSATGSVEFNVLRGEIVDEVFHVSALEDEILGVDIVTLLGLSAEHLAGLTLNIDLINGTFDSIEGNVFNYLSSQDWFGETELQFEVNIDEQLIRKGKIKINVKDVNDFPLANNEIIELDAETEVRTGNVLINDTDIDDVNLRVVEFSQPENGTVTYDNAGHFTYKPNHDFVGRDTIIYTIDDFRNGSAIASVEFNVLRGEIVDEVFHINALEDETLGVDVVTLLGLSSGQLAGLTLNVEQLNGTFDRGDGNLFNYLSSQDWFGETELQFEVNIDEQLIRKGKIKINVKDVNDFPLANNEMIELDAETEVSTGNVLENDLDIDSSEIRIVGFTQPSNGVVIYNNDGTFSYKPNVGFVGTDSIEYTVDDYRNGTSTGTIEFVVKEIIVDEPITNITVDLTDLELEVGQAELVVTVSLGATPETNITIDYETINDTAMDSVDFVASSGTLTWDANESSEKTFTIPMIVNKSSDEKQFSIKLTVMEGNVIFNDKDTINVLLKPKPTNDKAEEDSVAEVVTVEDPIEEESSGAVSPLTFIFLFMFVYLLRERHQARKYSTHK